ncbi:glutathione S-transferase family protein [Dongia sp. agr-C8]
MLTIHGVPISVHTRKVILAAIEKGIPYRNEPVIPFNPPEGWDRLSPTGKIPVVTLTDDATLCDSSVICAYLEKTEPNPPLYPTEAKAFADALWLEEYADGTLFREVVHGLFFQQVIRPKLLNQATDEAAVAAILETALPKRIAYLESRVGGDFLVDGGFGVADIAVMSNLINLHYLGHAIDGKRWPRLHRYFDVLLQRPSIRAALAAELNVASGMGLDLAFARKTDLAVA